jgi:cyclopropane fatty-acyl-phospholipid synthase-like methyltransferase
VLDTVVHMAAPEKDMTVLDLGVGTGNLALRFAALGCRLWGTDYSPAMLDKARRKMPDAQFRVSDLRDTWPSGLDRRFDRIVSAYVFHHFELSHKLSLARDLVHERLEPGGRLVIADLSFPDQVSMADFARSVGDLWEDEPYWLADQATPRLRDAGLQSEYQQVSPCAGVYRIEAA